MGAEFFPARPTHHQPAYQIMPRMPFHCGKPCESLDRQQTARQSRSPAHPGLRNRCCPGARMFAPHPIWRRHGTGHAASAWHNRHQVQAYPTMHTGWARMHCAGGRSTAALPAKPRQAWCPAQVPCIRHPPQARKMSKFPYIYYTIDDWQNPQASVIMHWI